MKNFVRAIRCSWPYRRRLAWSIVCALLAAVLWSLNFTAIYPVLKILSNEQNLQDWVEEQIGLTQREVNKWQLELDARNQELRKVAELQDESLRDFRERREHELTGQLAKIESKLNSARKSLYRYQLGRSYIYRILPTDRFQTLACLLGLVVIAVAVKGFFEFGQESLVGSVVNLSLYDLRNRFYRNVIHLDVNNFGEDGTHELMARFTNERSEWRRVGSKHR